MNTLLLSNDIGTVRIITDIIEMAYDDSEIELVSTIESFYSRIVGADNYYDLIVTDFRFGDDDNENILRLIKSDFEKESKKIVAVLQPFEADEKSVEGINYVVRPFSLDKIIELFENAINSDEE